MARLIINEEASDIEDTGRLESENLLRNRGNISSSKYLTELLQQSEADYNELVELIERERKVLDSSDQAFLPTLDLSVHNKAMEKHESGSDNPRALPKHLHDLSSSREREVQTLLDASTALLKTHRKATSTISDLSDPSFESEGSFTSFQARCRADEEHLKAVLKAGVRVCEREIGGLRAQPNGNVDRRDSGGGRGTEEESVAHGEVLFKGSCGKGVSGGDVEMGLKYLDKGVRKMVKGVGDRGW